MDRRRARASGVNADYGDRSPIRERWRWRENGQRRRVCQADDAEGAVVSRLPRSLRCGR
jgi:hypothetical protein